MHDYHRLKVWKRAHALARAVNAAMPTRSRRHSALVTQALKSADSIPNNIVEGRAADTDAEFARFLRISLKSSNELHYQLETSLDRLLIRQHTFDDFRVRIVEVQVLLDGLIRKLERDDRSGPDRAR